MSKQEKDFQHETDFLAALLERDDVPQDMRDYISDMVLEFQGEVSLYTPAVLRVVWPLIRQQEPTSGAAFWQAIVIALRTFADEKTEKVLNEIVEREKEENRAVTEEDEPEPPSQGVSTPPSECMEAATKVNTFVEEDIPDFIRDAVVDALREAAHRTGAPMPEIDEHRGYDLDALAYLFEAAWTLDLRAPGFSVTPTQSLAAHLAAVMAHPETPATLGNAISEELTNMSNSIDYHSPDMIERMLEAFKRRESQEEGGAS